MSWEDTLARLGSTTADALLQLLQLHEDGLLTRAQLHDALVELLHMAGLQGAVLGDTTYAAFMTVTTGTPPPAVGTARTLQAGPYPEKLHAAVATVLQEPDPVKLALRLARLGESDPLAAAHRAYGAALRADKRVQGWTRGLDAKACQLCEWWWREGRVWPKQHPMPTHPGCKCVQVPTSAAHIPETGYTRALRRRAEAETNTNERAAAVRAAEQRAAAAAAT